MLENIVASKRLRQIRCDNGKIRESNSQGPLSFRE